MKKLITLFAIITLTIITVSAANTHNIASHTLDKATAKLSIDKGILATFTISGGGIGTQKGTIAIKSEKFNARTANTIIWYDGKTQWLYNKGNNEVNISTPTATQQQSMNPYRFITIYKSSYTKLSQTNTANGYQIHIVGKKNNNEMYVVIDKLYNIKQVKMKQGSQWITIKISGITHKSFKTSDFRFKAKECPTAEIIDLR